MPYRESPPTELHCPRCRKLLPPLDVAPCTCGTWVTAFAATEVLSAAERAPDPVTRWWKVRAPCPICGEQMILRGTHDAGLFQGCDGHGFWLDADAVPHTSLARGIDTDALRRKRDDDARLAADREHREAAELERARHKADKHEREARLARELAEQQRAELARREAEQRAHREWTERGTRPGRPEPAPSPERVAARVYAALVTVAGTEVAEHLFSRLVTLERRNAELEARVRALETG